MKSVKLPPVVPVKKVTPKCYICSRTSKISALIGLVGIFACGAMVGWFQANSVNKKTVTAPATETTTAKPTLCQIREDALLGRIGPDHFENARTYAMLVKVGCPENADKYTQASINEKQISDAQNTLDKRGADYTIQPNDAPCLVIEKNLLSNNLINECEHRGEPYECYANNAAVYAQVAEEGCPEHAEFYKQRALEQIQISDGVRSQNVHPGGYAFESQTRSIVNAYNSLKMKEEARKYLKKVEKLVGPGVDFIMEIQRVIDEH